MGVSVKDVRLSHAPNSASYPAKEVSGAIPWRNDAYEYTLVALVRDKVEVLITSEPLQAEETILADEYALSKQVDYLGLAALVK